MMMPITILETESHDSLYCQYSSQNQPQNCYVQLDCDAGVLSASYNAEIGNAVPMSVWHGHTLRWSCPLLTGESADELMRSLEPLAERIVAGYEAQWDGSNHVARLTDDAMDADNDARQLCEGYGDEQDLLVVWDASEWLTRTSAADLGITATTTDDELVAISLQVETDAETEGVDVIEGVDEVLERMRQDLRDDAQDAANEEIRDAEMADAGADAIETKRADEING
jgi:hypothetical protein